MRREVLPPINFGQFVVANFNPPILWTRMELTNAILAGEHRRGKRVSLRAIRWDRSDELCVGKPAGVRYRNLRLQRRATQHRRRFRYRFSCGWGPARKAGPD